MAGHSTAAGQDAKAEVDGCVCVLCASATCRGNVALQLTMLLVDKGCGVQISGSEGAHENGAGPPAVGGHMLQGQGHIGLLNHSQLPMVACKSSNHCM